MSQPASTFPVAVTPASLGTGVRSATWRDYLALTKPRIMSLLVLTAVCAMLAASRGDPDPVRLLALVLGGAMACGGASALNHVLDRDIDRLMGPRTATRPVAAGRISTVQASGFGIGLTALSFLVMILLDNFPAAALTLAGGTFYVVIYTLWLKRATAQNIVIGGAAGAIPPLAGWAAAHGTLSAGALWLFLIVLLWTPPHFWALALLLAPHYAAADVPMMPVVRGVHATTRQVGIYSVLLMGVTLLPGVLGTFGPVYTASAAALGTVLCYLAYRLWREHTLARATVLFHYSLLYLALLFVAVALSAAVR